MTPIRAIVLAVVLAALAAAWSGLWVVAAGIAGRRLDSWQTAQAAQGRLFGCPHRVIAGFPFSITIACSGGTYVGQGRDHDDTAEVARLTAAASIFHPRTVVLSLRSPFSYRTSDGVTAVSATWETLDIRLSSLPDLRTIDLAAQDVAVAGVFGQSGHQSGKAARLSMRFTRLESRGSPSSADPMVAFTIAVGGTDLAVLDDLFGDTRPVDIDLAGTFDKATLGAARTPEATIDAWRRAGGRLGVTAARLSRDRSSVTAEGTLGLDEIHRPQGRLQAQFVGLGPLLVRYGLNPGLVAAGSLLGSLFGGPRQTPAPPGAISLPITLDDGRLGIGPIMTSITLPALY